MSSYDDYYDNICRLCLSYSKRENMVSLIDDSNNFSHYGKGVLTFANISLEVNDELPTKMCSKCLYFLRQTVIFKLHCEASDKQLRNLRNCSVFGSETFKERIVQYCIYKLYFPTECLGEPEKPNVQDKDEPSVNNRNFQRQCSEPDIIKFPNMNEITTPRDEIKNVCYDQNSCSKIKRKLIPDNDQLLDIMEKMIGAECEIAIDDFKQKKRKTTMKRRKALKATQSQSMSNKINANKSKKTSFKCRICHKILANPLTYKQHMQRHTGCRYICEHCGKGFPVRAELNIHRVARHGTGPYLQCQHCSFKAPRKFDLKEHERIHTGERPYACDKCGLTFRRRGIWKKHMVYHSEKKVQCTQCPRKFYQRSAMLAHANNIHDRMYVYLCNKCGVTYAKPATVRRHLTERHGIPREMQGKVIRVNKVSG